MLSLNLALLTHWIQGPLSSFSHLAGCIPSLLFPQIKSVCIEPLPIFICQTSWPLTASAYFSSEQHLYIQPRASHLSCLVWGFSDNTLCSSGFPSSSQSALLLFLSHLTSDFGISQQWEPGPHFIFTISSAPKYVGKVLQKMELKELFYCHKKVLRSMNSFFL